MLKGQQTILLATVTVVLFMVFVGSTLMLVSTGREAGERFRMKSSAYVVSSVLNRLQEAGEGDVVRELDGRYDIYAEGNVLRVSGERGDVYSTVHARMSRWSIRDTRFLPLSWSDGKIVLGFSREGRKALEDADIEDIFDTNSDTLLISINTSRWDELSYRDEKTEEALTAFSSGIQVAAIVKGSPDIAEDLVPYMSYVKYWLVNGSPESEKAFYELVAENNENALTLIGIDSYDEFVSYVSSNGMPDGVWFTIRGKLGREEIDNITEVLNGFNGLVGYLIVPEGDVSEIEKSLHSLPCRESSFIALENGSYEGLKDWWRSLSVCGKAYLHIDPWPFYWNPYVACEFEEKQMWRCMKAESEGLSSPLCDGTGAYRKCVGDVIFGSSTYGNPAMYDVKRCEREGMQKDGRRKGYFCAGWPDCEPSCKYEGRTGNVTDRYGSGEYERLWGRLYGAVWPDYRFDPMEHMWFRLDVSSPEGRIVGISMKRAEYRRACYPGMPASRHGEYYPPVGCILINSSHMGKPVKIRMEFVYPADWQRDWEKGEGIRPFTGLETVFIPQPGRHYVLDIDGKVKEIDEMPEWIRKRLNNIECSPGMATGDAYRGDCRFTLSEIDLGSIDSWPYEAEMRDIGSFTRPLYAEQATPGTGGGSEYGKIDTTRPVPASIANYADSYNRFLSAMEKAIRDAGLDVMLGAREAMSAMAAIITQESHWNENVGCNSFGDCGLTQINVRSTARSCENEIMDSQYYDSGKSFEENAREVLSRDHAVAIKCGAMVLAGKMKYLSSKGIGKNNPDELFKMALAAYNGGDYTVYKAVDCYANRYGMEMGVVAWEDLASDLVSNLESSCLSETLKNLRVCISNPEDIGYCEIGGDVVDGCTCKGLVMKEYVDKVVPYYEAWMDAPRAEQTEDEYGLQIDWVPAADNNFNSGRSSVEYIVIHYTAGSMENAIAMFRNDRLRNPVSAHYIVGKDGRIVQMVREEDTAWHAGCRSSDTGCIKPGINEKSIGIEVENYGYLGTGFDCNNPGHALTTRQMEECNAHGQWDPYTDVQMDRLARLVAGIAKKYGIPADRNHIIGHDEVNSMKSDPGPAFDWNGFIERVRQHASTSAGEVSSPREKICIHTIRRDIGGIDNTIALLDELGAKWAKDIVEWSQVEPSPGERRWNDADKLYNKLSQHGIKLIPRLHVAPDWAKRSDCRDWGAMPAETHFQDFARFVADFVERYRSSPAWSGYVEIWNEPNYINEAYCDHVEPDKFAALLKAVHQELVGRGIRNDVKIVLGGLGPTATDGGFLDEFDFLTQLYESDSSVGRYYDILGYHPYGQWNDYDCKCGNEAGTCNIVSSVGKDCWAFDRMRKVYEHLRSLGDSKKFLITEFSWRESEYESDRNKRRDIPVNQWQMENIVKAYGNMFSDYPFLEKPACYWVMSSKDIWKDTGDLLKVGYGASPSNDKKRDLFYCMKNLLGKCDDESLMKAPLCPCQQATDSANQPESRELGYEESSTTIKSGNYRLVKLWNGVMEVEVLPELGGRIWQVRRNGKGYLYNNPGYRRVPNWGVNRCSPGNWLPLGGIEISFPDSEHGCIYEEPFSYEIQQSGNSITLRLYRDVTESVGSNTVTFRVEEHITLEKGSDRARVRIEITNTGDDADVQLWINAMARIADIEPLDGYRIEMPCSRAEIHSASDSRICQNPDQNGYCKGLEISWPSHNGIDLSDYSRGNVEGWIGLFGKPESCSAPSLKASAGGRYLEIRPLQGFATQKFFGPGTIPASTYTSSGRTYVELWIGATRNFDTDMTIRRGEKRVFEYELIAG